jgi:hypothetical protein
MRKQHMRGKKSEGNLISSEENICEENISCEGNIRKQICITCTSKMNTQKSAKKIHPHHYGGDADGECGRRMRTENAKY